MSPPLRAFAVLALLAATPPAPAQFWAGKQLPLNVGGRARSTPDGALRFGWPGVYFEGRFSGKTLKLRLQNGDDRLRLLIDGQERARYEEARTYLGDTFDLPDRDHWVRLEKLSESQTVASQFWGFETDGQPEEARPLSIRKIEFIGDSYTVGYGNTAPGRDCTAAQVRETTDTQQAYGPVIARRFRAQYRVIAYSGSGVVRNYNGANPGKDLPSLYPRLVPSEPAVETDPGAWRPQVIVINLGTNDFSTPLHAGEPWADDAALRAAWRARYIAFAGPLLARTSRTLMILMGSESFIGDLRQVAAALGQNAPGRVSVLPFGDLELTGCNWHPSLKDHQHLAELLETEIVRVRGTNWPVL